MRLSRPHLDLLLTEHGGDPLADKVAEMIADYMGSTKKFVDFCLAFLPDPPAPRPPEWCQLPWADREMRVALREVYRHRSQALHSGLPVPNPMCLPPRKYEGAYSERIEGSAAGGLGGIWRSEDIPMLLHTFEHIARRALLGWWSSLPITDASTALTQPPTKPDTPI